MGARAPRPRTDGLEGRWVLHRDVARSTQSAMEDCLMHLFRGLEARKPELQNLCYAVAWPSTAPPTSGFAIPD